MAWSNLQMGFIGGAIASTIASATVIAVAQQGAIAQAQPPCDPPAANEYLLMVVYRSPAAHDQLLQALPRNTTATVCDYLGTTVSRVGGFTDLEVANSWAQFLADIGGLQAFVARPAGATPEEATPILVAPTPTAQPSTPQPEGAIADQPTPGTTATELAPTPFPQPTPAPAAQPTPSPVPVVTPTPAASPSVNSRAAYNPQVLGTGYAVLVDYANRPEVATQLQQVISTPVGLVSYEQRPYLLATYTSDLTAAAAVLQSLSDRNFVVVMVDSRRAVLLTPQVVTE